MTSKVKIGIFLFLGWAGLCNYWYVCQIQGLCGEEEVRSTLVVANDDPDPQPEPEPVPGETAEPVASDEPVVEEPEELEEPEEPIVEEAPVFTPFSDENIRFGLNSSQVIDRSKTEQVVKSLLSSISDHPDAVIRITGHTCSLGSQEYNEELGNRRAQAIKTLLIEKGADPGKIVVTTAGESNPLYDNDTEDNRSKNRRVSITTEKPNSTP